MFGGYMRITTKNALITGCFVVVAALITAVAMFRAKGPPPNAEVEGPNNVTSVGQSDGITAKVVSEGQTGGITADKVTVSGDYVTGYKNTTIELSEADREAIVNQIAQEWDDRLRRDYPKAHGVFGITPDGFVVPKGLIPDAIKIFWDTGKVYNISETKVEIVFPDIIPYAGMRTSGTRTTLDRIVGAKSGPLIRTGSVSPILEIIGIQGDLVIVALGLEELK
jgi:hypothetical protein